MQELYIGLLSGTSVDAVDAALIDFSHEKPLLLAIHKQIMPSDLRQAIMTLCQPGENEINKMGMLDRELGLLFASTAKTLLQKTAYKPQDIQAIGSHGQAIRHHPNIAKPFTLQIADPNIIAAQTGITTIADFRRRDLAVGGQGAPLAPGFHHHVFHSEKEDRIVLNIGGIANITWLPKDKSQAVIGFDTGPGNTLLDAWINRHLNQAYDKEGQWAASGKIHQALLDLLLSNDYLKRSPPKSTGPEYFHLAALEQHMVSLSIDTTTPPQDIQATLVEFTALSIAQAIERFAPTAKTILICGGGLRNSYLIKRLATHCPSRELRSTADFGMDPEWVEAATFAWLAQQTTKGLAGNLPSVTGAKQATLLGGIYPRQV